MADTDRNETDALAAEYVLGQLAGAERRAAEARLTSDPAFRAAVAAWERRLQPLADSAEEAIPPSGVLTAVLARIETSGETPGGNVVSLRRAVRRWRATAAIVGAAAAVLAGVVVLERTQPLASTEFVAVLTAEGAKPAFVATIDTVRGTISVRRVADAAPPGKSYELWAVPPGGAPRSLGLVQQASLSRPLSVTPSGNLTFAISLEPEGGSPTGAPTGPVVFSGALVPTE